MVGCHRDRFKPIMEPMIESKLVGDGSIKEYKDMVVGFS
jgi:hypothetical protein